MNILNIEDANTLYGTLADCYKKATELPGYEYGLQEWKKKTDRPPKYMTRNYFERLLADELYCPKTHEIKEIKLQKNTNIAELVQEIDKELKGK